MERIEDERLLFFIEHAAQIRQWAALEGEVQTLTDRFLRSMVTRWEDQDLDIDGALLAVTLNDHWPRCKLYRPEWMRDQKPLAAVTLEWESKRVGLDPDTAPYIGVRIDVNAERAADLRQRLQQALAPHRKTTRGGSSKFWAASRRVPPGSEGTGDLVAFEARILNELREEWQATSAHVDRIVATHQTPTGGT